MAALLVVMHHAVKILHDRMDGASGWDFHAGAAGVDVFFCISGFVIVISSVDFWGQGGSSALFLWRRVSRIVPLYWLATTLKLMLLLAVPRLAQHSAFFKPWHAIASFLFIPTWNVDHAVLPLLPQGWTLSFEMLFYALFAAALAMKLRPVGWITAVLVVLSVADLLRTDDWGAIATLLRPILLEFAFGMWIAAAVLRGVRLPERIAQLLVVSMPILLLASNLLPEKTCVEFSVLIWGLPGGLLLLAAVSLEDSARKWLSGLPNLLGDASYAIYLFHGFVAQPVILCLMMLHLDGLAAISLTVGISILAACAVGILIHNRVEMPLLKYLHRHNPGSSRLAPQSGSSVPLVL
jgi:peptidoglycan/LPS O-acetylase OafA/YrhL